MIEFLRNVWIFLGGNLHLHVCLEISHEGESTNSGIPVECMHFSQGEMHICMYVWISPGEKSKHTCKYDANVDFSVGEI